MVLTVRLTCEIRDENVPCYMGDLLLLEVVLLVVSESGWVRIYTVASERARMEETHFENPLKYAEKTPPTTYIKALISFMINWNFHEA